MEKSKIMLHGYRQLYSLQKKPIYVEITKYVETRFDASNYKLERPIPKKNIAK